MATWGELRALRPDLAEAGRDLLYQHGVGLAFLATVRSDGGPRVHPICPVLDGAELYGFLVPSPKRDDLARDPRYALHSFPSDDDEDAVYLRGRARLVDGRTERAAVAGRFLAERPGLSLSVADLDDQLSFAFDVASFLLTRTTGHGDPDPRHTVWREGD